MIRNPSSAKRCSRRRRGASAQPKAWPEVLLPWAVAESVCREAGVYLGVAIPRSRARWLAAKAEICFQRNASFQKKMLGRGDAPIGWLRTFMRHWLSSILKLERPDLWSRLPDSFSMGHRLPMGKAESRLRSVYKARRWSSARVWSNPRWAFLAPGSPVARRSPPAAVRANQALPYAGRHEYPIC